MAAGTLPMSLGLASGGGKMSNFEPKKHLGQHWLYDENTLESICDAVSVDSGDNVLEIGPGLGTLTARLLRRGASVTAVEFDQNLAAGLSLNIAKLPPKADMSKLTVVCQDILSFDLRTMPAGYKVVANIPYYLTSKLLRTLSESANPPSSCVLLIQREVAVRVCASPGQMSILAATTQFYFEPSLGVFVSAKLFTPPPKVDSQVLILKRREKPYFDMDHSETKKFFGVIKAGFGEKRKILRNSLSGGLGIDKTEVDVLLEKSGLTPNARAQELSLDDWKTIYDNWTR
jgi:16S rRNA (adenine1518-N6/adenine1519-N6)-dimethyltransferase